MNKKIVIIAPYPKDQAPSQRFRFEQYMEYITAQGFEIEFHSFLSMNTWEKLYKNRAFFTKAFGIIGSFLKRFILMFRLRKVDHIFIHREASMIGPPIFEWIIAKVLRKKFIYDFDDAIWLPNYSESNARFHRLKSYGKIKRIMKWAHIITAGNEYLKNYALQFNDNVQVIPTTIDLKNHHTVATKQEKEIVNIGWTGTHTTMNYLEEIIPVLKKLEEKYAFTFTVISNEKPSFELRSLNFVKWNKSTEINDLAQFNIGVMPLLPNKWSEGKCGFKGLQYMALEIPALMSPIGVNKEIIEDGVNGFLCATAEEWQEKLTILLTDKKLRTSIGKKGKETVSQQYSVEANQINYLNLFT